MYVRPRKEIEDELSRLQKIRHELADRINTERYNINLKQNELIFLEDQLSRLGVALPMAIIGEAMMRKVTKQPGAIDMIRRIEFLRKEIDRELNILRDLQSKYTMISNRILGLMQELNRMYILEETSKEVEINRLLKMLRDATKRGDEPLKISIIRRLRELGYMI
ncbi:MAG: hypothetical protein RMI45_08680 [Ignisphaera sp.]|nr:hypothetical protein [Ignisphaera sp.]